MTNDHGHILVVDDYAMNRMKLSRFLQKQGHTITLAEHGKQAVELIDEQSFDLMLLDIEMPEMDGYQVLEYMKQREMLRNLPVIVISASDEMESVIKCIKCGAEDHLPKPFDPVLLNARIGACLEKKRLRDREIERQKELSELNKALEIRNRFIRKIFGRYLSDDIVDTILESPEGLALGGEKRTITIMMTDLRGFTAIGERQPPENVVDMINIYLDVMTKIILKYQGTIDEFIGDAILALFGAPIVRDDDAKRAVACALEMQVAMAQVNQRNQAKGYLEVSMGIGLNTGDVVVGNIGSSQRTKYGVVGHNVNLASRIESYTVGGQILISESTLRACGGMLRIDSQMDVMPKGVKEPITIFEIGGIGGEFNIFLPEKTTIALLELRQPLPVKITILEGKHAGEDRLDGKIVGLKDAVAAIRAQGNYREFTNLKISLFDHQGNELTTDLYAKVTKHISESPPLFRVHFTSVPPEAEAFFAKMLSLQKEI